jgi:hypothetical protein
MKENIRLVAGIIWLISAGMTFASFAAVVISWGDYVEYFIAALIAFTIASIASVITSL